jgi:hypothetical protein
VFTIVACTSLGVISPKYGIELKITRKMYESALGYGNQRAFKFPFPWHFAFFGGFFLY